MPAIVYICVQTAAMRIRDERAGMVAKKLISDVQSGLGACAQHLGCCPEAEPRCRNQQSAAEWRDAHTRGVQRRSAVVGTVAKAAESSLRKSILVSATNNINNNNRNVANGFGGPADQLECKRGPRNTWTMEGNNVAHTKGTHLTSIGTKTSCHQDHFRRLRYSDLLHILFA